MAVIVNTSSQDCNTSTGTTDLSNVYLYSLQDVSGNVTPDVGKTIIGSGTEWVTIEAASFAAVTQFVTYIADAVVANSTISNAFVDASNPTSSIVTGTIITGAGTTTDPLDFNSLNIPLLT